MIRRPVRWLVVLTGVGALACQPAPPPAAPAPAPARPAAVAKPAVAPGTIKRIDLTAFFTLQQTGNPLIYDVRPMIFYSLGHVPGALNWPKNGFTAGLPRHEAELRSARKEKRPVVLYCTDRACPDAGTVARKLAALGYSVSLVDGGFEEWKTAGLPTE